MNKLTKTLIASAALLATAIVPVSGAYAAGGHKKAPGNQHSIHKGGPGYHYKRGPRVTYPRGYNKHRPTSGIRKGSNNAAALGILSFAAGAIVGNALAR